MVWDLSDGRGLQNCPVRPCRLGVVSGGNEDHKQAPYPPPRPAHTQPKPLPIPAPVAAGRVATGAHKRSLTNATRATTARSGGLSAAPHPPDALGQPAPTLGGFTAASAPSAPPSPRAARAPGRTPERRPINRVETRRRPASSSPATRRVPPPPPARTGEALTAASRCRVARRLRWQQCSRRRRRVSPSGARPRV